MSVPTYIVNRSTTLIQIDSSIQSNAIVWLSSVNTPGSFITIRDIAGHTNYYGAGATSNNLITVSTMEGIQFIHRDFTDPDFLHNSSIQISQPYGFLTVTPKSYLLSFTGSISNTTLTVTGTLASPLSVGQIIEGAGITGRTTITALGTGSGGAGTYVISPSQNVLTPRTMVVKNGSFKWAVVNTQAFPSVTTAANLVNITVDTSFLREASISTGRISTLSVNNIASSNLSAVSTTLESNLYVPFIYNSSLFTSSILTSTLSASNITASNIYAVSTTLASSAYIPFIYNSSLYTSSIMVSTITINGNIVTSGNLGIGTTTPTNCLNIASNVAFGDLLSATNIRTKAQVVISQTVGTGSLYIGNGFTSGVGTGSVIQSTDYFASAEHGTTLFLNPLGGNLNIGSDIKYATNVWNTSSEGALRYNYGANSHTYYQTRESHIFRYASNSTAPYGEKDLFTIFSNGNVTAAGEIAGTRLSLSGTGSYGLIYMKGDATETPIMFNDPVGALPAPGFTGWYVGQTPTWGAAGNSFGISRLSGGGAVAATGLWITASGNMGIGNPTPAYKLDVNGTANIQTGLSIGNATLNDGIRTYNLSVPGGTNQLMGNVILNTIETTGYVSIGGVTTFATNVWNKSSEGKDRLNFGAYGPTYYSSGNGSHNFVNSNNSVTTFSIDNAGNVAAAGVYSGNGSGLTNLPAPTDIFGLLTRTEVLQLRFMLKSAVYNTWMKIFTRCSPATPVILIDQFIDNAQGAFVVPFAVGNYPNLQNQSIYVFDNNNFGAQRVETNINDKLDYAIIYPGYGFKGWNGQNFANDGGNTTPQMYNNYTGTIVLLDLQNGHVGTEENLKEYGLRLTGGGSAGTLPNTGTNVQDALTSCQIYAL